MALSSLTLSSPVLRSLQSEYRDGPSSPLPLANDEDWLQDAIAAANDIMRELHAGGCTLVVTEIHEAAGGRVLPQIRVTVAAPGVELVSRPESVDG